ncbi:1428_t:CDS:2 [Gigaspora rosea]|nr:1428_t:CDS:2 [Gigaspora rosea]
MIKNMDRMYNIGIVMRENMFEMKLLVSVFNGIEVEKKDTRL